MVTAPLSRENMIPQTQLLLEDVGKRKFNTHERRQVVIYLKATDPEMTNVKLASMFDVTERTIRLDLQAFRKEKAQFIKEDDVGLIIADIALDYERQIRDIERSKIACEKKGGKGLGTLTYLKHCTDAMALRIQMVKALQDLGYYPKNLGTQTIEKFEYKADVDKGGHVVVRPVDYFDTTPDDSRLLDGDSSRIKDTSEQNPGTTSSESAVKGSSPNTEGEASKANPTESASAAS
jgi:hypothetical protein